MTSALLLLPLLAGTAAFLLRDDRARRRLLLWTAWAHLLLSALTARAVLAGEASGGGPWFAFDRLGLLFLLVTTALFTAAAHYAVVYLASEKQDPGEDADGLFIFNNAPEAVFTGCLLLFLGAMTAVAASRHMGLLWAAVEATTLLSAPLIYFHRHKRSLEATWKYLLICSVGIALALMGNLFLGAAGLKAGAGLGVEGLLAGAAALDKPLLKAAFLFLLVGYGTKTGLAPFHTWLPDAHSEAPAVVSALLSGALLNCAFLGLLRASAVCSAAGLGDFSGGLLILFGLLSVLTAALFMLAQHDYKRMLAYSSIEHMGLAALGAGLGGGAVFGALLGAVSHSLAKAGLFFTSGLVLAAEKTKAIAEVRGLKLRAPRTAALWLLGFLLITGVPPSGVFLAKFVVLREALASGRWLIAASYLLLLAVLFAGMARSFIPMVYGERAEPDTRPPFAERRGLLLPAAALLAGAAFIGLWIPDWLQSLLAGATAGIGGRP